MCYLIPLSGRTAGGRGQTPDGTEAPASGGGDSTLSASRCWGVSYEATRGGRSPQLREAKGSCWTCPGPSQVPCPPLPTRLPARKWVLRAASTGPPGPPAPAWVRPAGAPGESRDGRQERAAPLSPRLSLRECGWTPTCSSTRGHSSQRGASPSCSLRPLRVPGSTLPRPLRAQRNERPHRCWPWSPSPAPASSSADPALILPSPSHASPSLTRRRTRPILPECSASARERWGGDAKFPKLRAVLVFHIRPALPAPGEQATQRRGL